MQPVSRIFAHASSRPAELSIACNGNRAATILSVVELVLSLLPELERDDAWNEIADAFAAYETSARLKLPGEQLVITGTA